MEIYEIWTNNNQMPIKEYCQYLLKVKDELSQQSDRVVNIING